MSLHAQVQGRDPSGNYAVIRTSVGGKLLTATSGALRRGSKTRPDNTTAYAAGDVWGDADDSLIEIANMVPAVGDSGTIGLIGLVTSDPGITGKIFKLAIFNDATTADIADNAAFSLAYADVSKLVCITDPIVCSVENGTDATAHAFVFVNIPFTCKAAGTSLYVQPIVADALTPTAEEALTVILG